MVQLKATYFAVSNEIETNFNSYMVQLKDHLEGGTHVFYNNFNSYMVQLKVVVFVYVPICE